MGDHYRVVAASHRRPRGDDEEVFEQGDVFEPTEEELDAFGDKFEQVEQDGGEWVAVRSSPTDGPSEPGTYRLVSGTHRQTIDGESVVYEEGDLVDLSAQEVEAFGDKFERVESESEDAEGDAEGDESPDGGDHEDTTPRGDGEETAEDTDDVAPAEGDTADESATEGDDAEETGSEDLALAVPDTVDRADLPEDFPATLPDDWQDLKEVAKANDVSAGQSKPDMKEDLRAKRDARAE